MSSKILSLNCGSSSLKYALFDCTASDEHEVTRGNIDKIGNGGPATHDAAVAAMFKTLNEAGYAAPAAVGHRIVHGGPKLLQPRRLDATVWEALEAAVPFAPLHLPAELAAIRAVAAHFADVPQVVAFDTGFHRAMPIVAQRFALPRALYDAGIHRYGFHGLSYELIVSTVGATTLKRAVIAHLGSGASMVAVKHGSSVDTTMGFTPTGGLVMGTRSGDLDPGLLVYLLAHGPYDVARLDHLINHEAGLLALSESTPDMQKLLALVADQDDPRAVLAIDVFCYHARKAIGALATTLGGIDTLVFTGGIGEHAPEIRRRICSGLEYMGIRLDDMLNARHDAIISRSGSACTVRVVATNEERMIARHTRRLLETPV